MCGPDQKDKGTPMYRVVPTGGRLDADRIAEMRARLRARLDAQEAAHALAEQMRTLARNLRDAAGCALAAHHYSYQRAWRANLDGRAAPGWER